MNKKGENHYYFKEKLNLLFYFHNNFYRLLVCDRTG